jgi:hypothetical protein
MEEEAVVIIAEVVLAVAEAVTNKVVVVTMLVEVVAVAAIIIVANKAASLAQLQIVTTMKMNGKLCLMMIGKKCVICEPNATDVVVLKLWIATCDLVQIMAVAQPK